MNVVRLSVHKNTRDQRRAKEARKAFRDAAAHMIAAIDAPAGFAIVVWDDSNGFASQYRASRAVPVRLLPEMARGTLMRAVEKSVT